MDDSSDKSAVYRHSAAIMNGNTNLHESPLKAPAVEIIDLLSEAESGEEIPCANGCDAWESEEESDEDDQDEDGLSIYEEALAAMDDEELADAGKSPFLRGGGKSSWLTFSGRGLNSRRMHTRRVSRLPSKVTADRGRSIHQRDCGSANNNCQEIMHSFWHPIANLLGWRTRYFILPFAGSLHFPGTFETAKTFAIQHDRRCCVSPEGFEECNRLDRSRGQSF